MSLLGLEPQIEKQKTQTKNEDNKPLQYVPLPSKPQPKPAPLPSRVRRITPDTQNQRDYQHKSSFHGSPSEAVRAIQTRGGCVALVARPPVQRKELGLLKKIRRRSWSCSTSHSLFIRESATCQRPSTAPNPFRVQQATRATQTRPSVMDTN